jgi:hypothetical protein
MGAVGELSRPVHQEILTDLKCNAMISPINYPHVLNEKITLSDYVCLPLDNNKEVFLRHPRVRFLPETVNKLRVSRSDTRLLF